MNQQQPTLEQQIDFKNRRDKANKAIDRALAGEELGIKLIIQYTEQGIVPGLQFVDLKTAPKTKLAPTPNKFSPKNYKKKKNEESTASPASTEEAEGTEETE